MTPANKEKTVESSVIHRLGESLQNSDQKIPLRWRENLKTELENVEGPHGHITKGCML
jgi:hypothetical protein